MIVLPAALLISHADQPTTASDTDMRPRVPAAPQFHGELVRAGAVVAAKSPRLRASAPAAPPAAPDAPPALAVPVVPAEPAPAQAADPAPTVAAAVAAAPDAPSEPTLPLAIAAAAPRALPPALSVDEPATPLEQAIHDLLRDLERPKRDEHAEHGDEPAPIAPTITSIEDAPRTEEPQAAAATARSQPPAEAPHPTSHVHLVLDDAGQRLVVTVAVRGSDVHVAMRAPDDAAAALARNAGSLDHALRGRGLSLADLDVQREPPREAPRERRDEKPRDTGHEPAFTLEEMP